MSNLQQLQVTYAPTEDRILLRVSTTDRQELRFWLTRRLVLRLLPGLDKALVREPAIGAQPTAEARQEVLRFRREKAVSEANFATPYRDDAEAFPLGEQPVLVTAIRMRRVAEGKWALALVPAAGQQTEMALNEHLVHSLTSLVRKAAAGAEWGEAQPVPTAPEGPPDDVTIN